MQLPRVYPEPNYLLTLLACLVSYWLGSFWLNRLMQSGNFGVLMTFSNTTQIVVIILISLYVFVDLLTRA